MYLVIEPGDPPRIVGLYWNKANDEKAAAEGERWRNVVRVEVKDS